MRQDEPRHALSRRLPTVLRRARLIRYVGTRPTFGIGERLLEVYLLDQDVDLYGERIDVHFIERLRDDACFDSAEALAESDSAEDKI